MTCLAAFLSCEDPVTRQDLSRGIKLDPAAYPGDLQSSHQQARRIIMADSERHRRPREPNGETATCHQRRRRRAAGRPNWRIVPCTDDFVVLSDGERNDVEALREDITKALQPLGLRLAEAKTQVVHMAEGFEFLGFRIQWRRKRGTDKWHVHTFIADRPIQQLKDKIRALTNRTLRQNLRNVLVRLNQITRSWANYFKHAVCRATLNSLAHFAWHR
ncbi:group II intron maturase-specific domain-containing protein [Streptomyces sp. NPDC056930]|uniref:group II intron maturase-specific domain-containing protein n=1 Tax=Streptomyces sp. NPDC056930 TaxID=3345967 RepID=UPI003629373A